MVIFTSSLTRFNLNFDFTVVIHVLPCTFYFLTKPGIFFRGVFLITGKTHTKHETLMKTWFSLD